MRILVAALLALASQAHAQGLATTGDARKLADDIMAGIGAGNLDAALTLARPQLLLPPAEADAMVAQVNSQMRSVGDRYGAARGFDFVRQETAGESLVRLTYVARYERAPIRWRFVFYKGDKAWGLTDFGLDTNRHAAFAD
jgi:hypothetical protein